MSSYILRTTAILLVIFASAHGEAKLKVRSNRFEMGSIPPGSTVTHSFWFRSVGADTAVISSVWSKYGCQEDLAEEVRIPPGDSAKLNFCWDVSRRTGASGCYPYIYTNADSEPMRVYMTGTVLRFPDSLRPVCFKPFILDLSRFGDKSVDSLVFEISNLGDKDLTLTRLSFDIEECEIEFPETVPANSKVAGLVKIRPEYLDKEFRKSFTILIDDDRDSRITVPVRRRVY